MGRCRSRRHHPENFPTWRYSPPAIGRVRRQCPYPAGRETTTSSSFCRQRATTCRSRPGLSRRGTPTWMFRSTARGCGSSLDLVCALFGPLERRTLRRGHSLMTPLSDIELIRRLLTAAVLGGVLGFEREIRQKSAGLRTNILIAIGSALFTLMSYEIAG